MREILPPHVTPETAAFWAACAEGRLLIPKCRACGRAHYYPRRHCPFCLSPGLEQRPASGRAELASFSIMRHGATPYACGYVTLAEGPMMFADLVVEDFACLQTGMALRLTFLPYDGGKLPAFEAA